MDIEKRRDLLMEAALDEFASKGYHQTKIADLCSRAGVSPRGFYEKFASKEALLLELHTRINRLAFDRIRPLLDCLPETDTVTRISTLAEALVAAITADPRYPRITCVEATGVSAAMERQRHNWFARHVDLIEAEANRAVEAGLAPRRDYRLTAIALAGAVLGLLHQWQSHNPPVPAGDIADEIRAMMLAAITRPVTPDDPDSSWQAYHEIDSVVGLTNAAVPDRLRYP